MSIWALQAARSAAILLRPIDDESVKRESNKLRRRRRQRTGRAAEGGRHRWRILIQRRRPRRPRRPRLRNAASPACSNVIRSSLTFTCTRSFIRPQRHQRHIVPGRKLSVPYSADISSLFITMYEHNDMRKYRKEQTNNYKTYNKTYTQLGINAQTGNTQLASNYCTA